MSSNSLAGIVKLALVVGSLQLGSIGLALADTTILNVSYDPTRELYKEFNAALPKNGRPTPAKP